VSLKERGRTDGNRTTGAEQAATGLPQLDFSTFPNQIFWLLVTLVAIYMILTRLALPRIGGVLAERAGTITERHRRRRRAQAQGAGGRGRLQQGAGRRARRGGAIVAEARAEIQADLDVATAKADAEIAARAAESEKRIGEIREGTLAAVRQVADETAREIVSALGVTADEAAVTARVAERMKG
jgi:F-type H+-transporting ATPase subunit b